MSKIRLPPPTIGSLPSIAACFPRRRNVAPDASTAVPFIAAGETVAGSGERAVFAKDRRLDLRVEADPDNREIASRGEFLACACDSRCGGCVQRFVSDIAAQLAAGREVTC